jgi:hypothetical protein
MVKRGEIDTNSTRHDLSRHDLSRAWLNTRTSIKHGGVKLVF